MITRSLAVVASALVAAAGLAGCTPEDRLGEALATCIEMNQQRHPGGITDARDGQLLDAEEICYATVATQGKERFIELFSNAEWVACYARAETSCTPAN